VTKKHLIALADAIIAHNDAGYGIKRTPFTTVHLMTLAGFCQSANPNFNQSRWLGYIAGTNGQNGGARKLPSPTPTIG
jgi:hypothetical protein